MCFIDLQGCFEDVQHILHQSCSGKRECSLDVIEVFRSVSVKPCKGLMSYLEVSYTCTGGKELRLFSSC